MTLAALLHKSAIFFYPAYFLLNITLTPLIVSIYFSILAVVYIFRVRILSLITSYMYSGVEIVSTGAYTLLIIVLLTFVVGLFFYKDVIKNRDDNKLIYNLIAIAAALMIFNTVSNIGIRVANYYYIFMILFIPTILSSFRNNLLRHISIFIVIVFTLIYYFKIGVYELNSVPYMFFW